MAAACLVVPRSGERSFGGSPILLGPLSLPENFQESCSSRLPPLDPPDSQIIFLKYLRLAEKAPISVFFFHLAKVNRKLHVLLNYVGS